MTSPPFRDWQNAFVDKYIQDLPGTALLTARPGEGKGTATIQAWARLRQEYAFQNLIIITPSLLLRDQWRHMIEKDASLPNQPTANLLVHNVHQLRGKLPEELKRFYQQGKTFVIIDEIHLLANRESLKVLFVPSPIQYVGASQTLYLTGVTNAKQVRLLGDLLTGTEYLYDPDILRQDLTRKELARLSPSHALLQEFWQRGLTLDNISWRLFEKLVAELLEADGYTVQLMNGTKDGGVDVIAIKEDGISGFYKTLWQAKKYTKNKVGLQIIRELADSVRELNASKGIIVTTSFLTADAMQRVQRDKYTLSKVDRKDLEGWINRIFYK